MKAYPYYLAGEPRFEGELLKVYNPSDGAELFEVHTADTLVAEEAVQACQSGFRKSVLLPVWQRAEVLTHISRRLQDRKEEFAKMICREAGKPIQFARIEVDRAIQTFRLAVAWVWNASGETMDLSHAPGLEGKKGMVQYFPNGPCLLISPFNFPLNLVAHKVAPAIATGNAFILKPASATPGTAILLAELLAETSYPGEAWSVLPCSRITGQFLVEHPGLTLLSFTGSPEVGWKMKAEAGKKKVILELGGDAAVVVDETSDLNQVIPSVLNGAYAYAGQICISVQRIVVVKEIYETVKQKLMEALPGLSYGAPESEYTVCGPVIDESNTQRTLAWIEEARAKGSKLLYGGNQVGHNLIVPALLEGIPHGVQLREKEAFAPVAGLMRAEHFEHAVEMVNDSNFGLQTGVFTARLDRLKFAFSHLQVGGVIHNQAPTLRIDAMPYGGIKDSGLGREGVSWACREMCEAKVLVF
jgi:acyl-CoA reductase-like NAD-dependent aldehyde dehydrogenase